MRVCFLFVWRESSECVRVCLWLSKMSEKNERNIQKKMIRTKFYAYDIHREELFFP